jgi:hypothetical protein
VPSFCRQPHTDPRDQFPRLNQPEAYRACRPNQANPTPPCRPARAERAACSHAPARRLAPLCTKTCTAASHQHDATIAQPPRARTRPSRA